MDAVLYYKDNGFGLTQDAKVVDGILKKIGLGVIHSAPEKPVTADLSIHFEIPSLGGIKRSGKAIFFPNFEWFFFDADILGKFDVVACKTLQAVPIARNFSNRVVYTGFTSEDMRSVQSKRTLEFYHIGGQSRLKNTQAVIACWRDNPQFPRLHVYTQVYKPYNVPDNVSYHYGPVDRQNIKNTMNHCLVAVQPSATEGFGQVIWEALSTGSILITTAAPPMNEFPANFFVDALPGKAHNYQTTYEINTKSLADIVTKIISMSGMELAMESTSSRQAWVENANAFTERFVDII